MLVVVPVMYSLVDDIGGWLKNLLAGGKTLSEPKPDYPVDVQLSSDGDCSKVA